MLADGLGGVELLNNRAGLDEELAARVASVWSRRTGAGANRMPEVVNTDGAMGLAEVGTLFRASESAAVLVVDSGASV